MDKTDPRPETWDSYWRSGDIRYGPHKILIDHVLKHVPSKKAVIGEIGAGSGVDALEIAALGFSVVVVDLSMESLRMIKSRARDGDMLVLPVRGDALNLPFKKRSFDLIYHQGVMEHFKAPIPFLSQQTTLLRKGGRLLVDVPQTFTLHTLRKRIAMARGRWFAGWETQYTPRRLHRLLGQAGLKVMDFYGRDYELLPFVWLRDIETLGKTRFGRPILPRPIRRQVAKFWRWFERTAISKYITHCIGAVAESDENRN